MSENLKVSDDDQILYRVFTTGEGARALEVLKKRTVGKPVFENIGQDSGNTLALAAMREGQNNLVRHILRIIDIVERRAK